MNTLKEQFQTDFIIGAAVNKYTDQSEQELLKQHFNSITAENEMKFENLQPEKGKYTFDVADQFVAFAQGNDMKMRGHTLVWHNQTPDWFFLDDDGNDVSREELLARMKEHIFTVVSRYKGKIHAWDVVNEAVLDEGDDLYRQSKWLNIIGEDFIDYAFHYAHEADPDATLFYNDYNESDPVKRVKIYQLVKGLLDRGVPIHGIGLQAHWNLYQPSIKDIKQSIESYAELGLKIHITELDVSMFSFEDERKDVTSPTKEMLYLQAERYQQFFKVFHSYRDVIESVTFWGISDAYTWLSDFPVVGRKNWPFLFDESGNTKPAFDRVISVKDNC
ncbi:endo-1,4-beta-xylanase [Natronobacillus azotifigens]|uniref:Beta-xylanase n=1 Tax=Natronobacillus azotifigens TaxID=472978 RepID=A0A9J6RG14_9BACI|nr:endo-1,4-beta-xylanase [Natronobacillus azotifigens]MCZ0704275.1 endo-1,4-beta-xylanase [Natronobacillus azotifigens]